MLQPKFRSLHNKLLLSITIVAVTLAIVSSILAFYIEFDRTRKHTDMMLVQLLDTVENTASIATYLKNKEIATDVLKGLLKNDIIQGAKISSGDDFTLSLSKNKEPFTEEGIIRLLYSPFSESYMLGNLQVIPDAQFNLNEAKHSAIFSVITSIALITITSLIVFLVIQSNFSKPLELVSNT